jgi:phosphoserine aminotransferase
MRRDALRFPALRAYRRGASAAFGKRQRTPPSEIAMRATFDWPEGTHAMAVYNFAAGPACLPPEVLEQVRAELTDWRGCGSSVLELPFTGAHYKEIAARAEHDLRALLAVPDGYRVLFLQGGASGQFAAIPLNLAAGGCAQYVVSGHWSRRALAEARRFCAVHVAAETRGERVPAQREWRHRPGAAYCHITSNETADGVQYHWTPAPGGTPLVADMSSDFLSRPLDVARYGLIYASAQKNIGPAGLVVVIVREDLLERACAPIPAILDYRRQAESGSRYNTPPTFAVYVAALVFQWLRRRGGLAAAEAAGRHKSALLYAAIEASDGFYRCEVVRADRSRINVCYSLAEPRLEEAFLAGAEARGLRHLKGHPVRGGLRASLYNAMPQAGVEALVDYMQAFAARHG